MSGPVPFSVSFRADELLQLILRPSVLEAEPPRVPVLGDHGLKSIGPNAGLTALSSIVSSPFWDRSGPRLALPSRGRVLSAAPYFRGAKASATSIVVRGWPLSSPPPLSVEPLDQILSKSRSVQVQMGSVSEVHISLILAQLSDLFGSAL